MYKKHCSNLKQINYSIKEVEKSIKYAIKTNNSIALTTYTNIHSFLTGAWIEVSLYKLIYEQQFTESDRNLILSSNKLSLEEKWKNTLNLAFSKAFEIDYIKFGISSDKVKVKLSRTQQHWFEDLHDFIENDLNTVVKIRNKIAHGQWEFAFNNVLTAINPDMQKEIKTNHYFKSKLRLQTIKVIIEMIHDISISPKTFIRDFDNHFHRIIQIKARYNDEFYYKNNEIMREKFSRAEAWKNRNKN